MVTLQPENNPEEDADLKAEIEDWATVGIYTARVGYGSIVATVDDIDIQANEHSTYDVANWEDEVETECRTIKSSFQARAPRKSFQKL